ncbi:hypothetical protein Gasu2_20220 [Galdieria sulphuraria]|uniref:Uncharacterized protein n=1 Tax=Galdieria sulphuraria TaxID=130081 RepID=M2W671_GALSU|nr:uncharacterized protein Gasu_14960 [Galdieria sulphuraria]EME31256.1 hypothetical protein Gasu_14960 [Galdieria sulphuraria]GJD07677.1 hypothetical protein Gasu2_20220 [Galdieria sulphuraria]|eukprot:XP_005707776.1 hypothetical protein Gasu_14960 [Galdieria sulphuraria]
MQCVSTRLIRNRNRRLGVTQVHEAAVKKFLKRKLLQRCRERAQVSRKNVVNSRRTGTQETNMEAAPVQVMEEETLLEGTISETNFLDSLTEKEYEEWMVELERLLQEDLAAEQQEQDQVVVENKALEELEYERQLLEKYEIFIER